MNSSSKTSTDTPEKLSDVVALLGATERLRRLVYVAVDNLLQRRKIHDIRALEALYLFTLEYGIAGGIYFSDVAPEVDTNRLQRLGYTDHRSYPYDRQSTIVSVTPKGEVVTNLLATLFKGEATGDNRDQKMAALLAVIKLGSGRLLD